MAVQRFKVALNNARMPLVSTQAQRAVFVPGLDTAPRTSRQFTGSETSIDYNLAQVIFSENVMPTAQGISSVGYSQRIAAKPGAVDFDSVFALKDADENTVLYSPAGGNNYVHDPVTGLWAGTPLSSLHPGFLSFNRSPALCPVSYCYVEGFTFVCFGGLTVTTGSGTVDASIYWWNPATKLLEAAAESKYINLDAAGVGPGFAVGTISGIGASNGNLIVYSGIEIAWAPFALEEDGGGKFDFLRYKNNQFTGAGWSVPEDVQGNIRAVVALPGGFLAFTDKNCIAATYTASNLNSPWVFREVANAGGIESYEQCTVEGSLGICYAFTTAGLQRLSLNQAESAFPDVGDFIAGRYVERITTADVSRISGSTTLDLFIKLSSVGNRYIVVSYGTMKNRFTHALVYDIGLERWGKLAVKHRDCFYYNYGATTGNYTYIMVPESYDSPLLTTYDATAGISNAFTSAQHAIAFVTDGGQVTIADWSGALRETEDEAVAMIGRIQLTRTSNTQFNRVELDGFKSGSAFISVSTDGGDIQPAVPLILISQSPQTAVFGELLDGRNITLIVKGTFQLSTAIIEATTSGRM